MRRNGFEATEICRGNALIKNIKKRAIPTALGVLALSVTSGVCSTAQAMLVVLQPDSMSTDMGSFSGTATDEVRDQSGLSTAYTSGVTDFNTYIAGSPTHNSATTVPFATFWTSNRTSTGNVDFDLGGTFTVESLALWSDPNGVTGFELLADDNAAFSSPTSLGSFTPTLPGIGQLSAIPAEVFSFTATSASFIRMRITSSNPGAGSGMYMGEVAFGGQAETRPPDGAIPEPVTAGLSLLSLSSLALTATRRRA